MRSMIAILLSVISIAVSAEPSSYKLGVYYFPGWRDASMGAAYQFPWEKIKPYPEREPLSGWYKDGDVANTEQQLKWMSDYGINYVVYDWYWSSQRKTYLEHGLASYFKAANNNLVNFSILWANHDALPKSEDDFIAMVNYWVNYYFPRNQYQKIDGMPLVFVFSASQLENNARKFGKTTKDLFDKANQIAKSKGLPGIYFVGGVGAYDNVIIGKPSVAGYSAYSAYNYHSGRKTKDTSPFAYSHSFEELDLGYQYHWEWFFKNSTLPYIIPMTSGWDKRPWGGSKDIGHDDSISTPKSFEAHLLAAKTYMDKYPEKSLKTGVICCWNEFGEGSYIEPTKKYGLQYLEKIKKVFD